MFGRFQFSQVIVGKIITTIDLDVWPKNLDLLVCFIWSEEIA